jgi:hypothetical protein
MYSGSTLTTFSGRILGAHQKIDRVARRHLQHLAPGTHFPGIRRILHFEGGNGPDAIKRKSPAKDEPLHYFQPFDPKDTNLLEQISDHYKLLVKSLTSGDEIRAGFEAAWLAHAIVDGLTPAHHYPYEEKLTELRGGEGIHSRTSVKAKIVLPGDTKRELLANNWKMWGPGGLMTSHGTFEWGVATAIVPLRFRLALPTEQEIESFKSLDIADWYRGVAQEVANLGLYDTFLKTGWTIKLTRAVRKELAPRIVRSVTLAWYGALYEARRNSK